MKNIFIIAIIYLCAGCTWLIGQCPATDPTFSLTTPIAPGGDLYVIGEGVRTADGHIAVVGLKNESGTIVWHAYFAVFDAYGNYIVLPRRITPVGASIPGNAAPGWKAFITESYALSGAADGYIIAVNTGNASDGDIWVTKVNTQNCVAWGQRLGSVGDGFDDKAVDIVRKDLDKYAIVTHREVSGSDMMVIHVIDNNGTVGTTYEYPPSFQPTGITPVNSTAFGTNVKWAVCGTPSFGNTAVALLDDNFAEINNFADYFSPDLGSPVPISTLDIAELNGALYVSGVVQTPSTRGWLMKLLPDFSDPFANLQFGASVLIDLPDQPGFSTQEDIPWDLEAGHGRIAVGGWTYLSDVTLPYYPWLLTYDENLTLLHSTSLSYPGSTYGALQKVVSTGNGFYLIGYQWNNPGQSGGTRCFAGACDVNTSIGDCGCQTSQAVMSPQPMGGYIASEDYGSVDYPCPLTGVSAICLPNDSLPQVCYELPPGSNCAVSINSAYGECTSVAGFQAVTTGFGGPLTYTWSAPGGIPSTGSGASFNTDLLTNGTYTVCVTVTDGMCTADACTVVNLNLDPIDPVAICVAFLTVSVDVFGMAVITVGDVDDGSFDNCSLHLSLDKDFFTCADLGFNTVILTAVDDYGNMDFCQANVHVLDLIPPTVICPASVTVNGVLDANLLCNATVTGIAALATDNCPPPFVSYVFTGVTTGSGTGDASGSLFNQGLTTVTYTATDASGNADDCQFTVTVLPCTNLAGFEKLYGDAGYNAPTRIKAFGNHVFVAGVTRISGLPYATFTKFDPVAGDVVWDIRLDIASTITDFEYIPALESNTGMDGFLLVGRTEPFDDGTPQDNMSLLLRIDDLGATAVAGALQKRYHLTGRESFTRIVRHPNAVNQAFPYYVAGGKNHPTTPAPPSSADIIVLMNIDQNGNENFFVEYDYIAPDDEFARGMFPLNNGNLMLTGNDSPTGNGMLVEVSGLNGMATANAYILQADIDVYDGVQLPGGEIVYVGAAFALNQAVVGEILPGGGGYEVNFPELISFTEIGLDNLDRLYVIGEVKSTSGNGVPGRQVIHRLIVGTGGTPFVAADSPEAWYLEDAYVNEYAWENAHIFVSPRYDWICYADSRIGTNPYTGLGDHDMLIGTYGLDELATPSPDDCHFTVHDIPFQFGINFTPIGMTTLPSPHTVTTGIPVTGVNLVCHEFCAEPCTVEVTWAPVGNCYEIQFMAIATGTAPFSYAWDVHCDGIADVPPVLDIANPVIDFQSSGVFNVCLVVTDADGCQVETNIEVTVPPDVLPPDITCPDDITVGTDPGVCYSYQSFVATATDNCPPVTITYLLVPGGGTNPATNYPLGDTEVTATATDQEGLTDQCSFTVTVVDDEDPIVDCPDNIFAYVAACEQGLAVSFPLATATDNCTPFTLSAFCNIASGSFFPCGSTAVTCTATDASGNVGDCQFYVYVNCECMSFANGTIACVPGDPHMYAFSLDVLNASGGNNCNIDIVNNQSGVTMTYDPPVWNGAGTIATVTGFFTVTDPVANPLQLEISLTCLCPGGQTVSCALLYTFTPPCCEAVVVTGRELCYNMDTALIVLENCDNLYGVTQVNWYWGPCGAIPSTPKQVTSGCEPLLLLPSFMDEDICVYAVVFLNNNPCTTLTSNIAPITLCKEIVCSVSGDELCGSTFPIQPDPLELTLSGGGCNQLIEWVDPSGTIVQTGGLTYQPPPLSYTGSIEDCYQDYIYTVRITNDCGTTTCDGIVRFYNINAPKGSIEMHLPDIQPICSGDDVELEFIPDCAGDPQTWFWYYGTDGSNYNPIPGSGNSNPVYNTNELYHGATEHWFQVQSTNGVCPSDTVNFEVTVRPPLEITAFTAGYVPLCDQENVQLYLDFTNSADCNDTVEWYHNGYLLGSEVDPATPLTYNYDPVLPDRPEGYYYAIVKSCCGERETTAVHEILPPVIIELISPCFRCNDEIVTLEAEIFNMPPGPPCTYAWTASNGGNILTGQFSQTITADAAGTYTFEMTCGSCTFSKSRDLLQCGNPNGVIEIPVFGAGYASLYPNPTDGGLTLVFVEHIPAEGTLVITDVLGRALQRMVLNQDDSRTDFSIASLPAGIYFVKVLDGEVLVWMEKVVKE